MSDPSPPAPAPSTRSWRQRLFAAHRWTGLFLGLPLFVVCSSGTFAVFGHEWDWLADPARRVAVSETVAWDRVGETLDRELPKMRWSTLVAPLEPGQPVVAVGSAPRGQLEYALLDPGSGRLTGRRNVLSVQVYLRQFHKTFVVPYGIYAVTLLGIALLVSAVTGLLSYRRFWRHPFRLRSGRGLRVWTADAHRTLGVWSFLLAIVIALTGVWYLVEAAGHDLAEARIEPEPPTLSGERLAALGPSPTRLPIEALVDAARGEMPDLDVGMVRLPGEVGEPVRIDGQTGAWLVRDRASRVYLDPFSGEVLGTQRAEALNPLHRWSDTADPLHFGTFGGLTTKALWFLFGLLLSMAVLAGPALAELRRAKRQGVSPVRTPLFRPAVLISGGITVVALAAAVFASYQGFGSRILRGVPAASEVAGPIQVGPWNLAVTAHRAATAARAQVLLSPLGGAEPNWQEAVLVDPRGEPISGHGRRWTVDGVEGLALEVTGRDGTRYRSELDFGPAATAHGQRILARAGLDEPPLDPPTYVIVFVVALLLFELAGVVFWAWLALRRPVGGGGLAGKRQDRSPVEEAGSAGASRKPAVAALGALLLVVAGAGCGDDGGDGGSPPDDRSPDDPAFLAASRVLTPNGRTLFVSVEPDLDARTIDLGGALELNGFSRAYAFDGSVFTMDSESLQITRHEVTADLRLEPGATFSMAGRAVRGFRPLFAFLSAEKAYYVDLDGFEVIIWNPSTMEIEGSFPIPEVDREGFEEEATDIEMIGDRVFVTLAWTDFNDLDVIPVVAVVILDGDEDRLIALPEDDRCVAAGGAFVGGDDELVVIGDNDDGRYALLGDDELPPPCLLRIRAGEDGFDPNFYVDLAALTGAPEVGHIAGRPDGTAITRGLGREVDLDEVDDVRDLAFAEVWEWVVLDLDEGTSSSLDVPLSALPFPPFEVRDELYFQREDGDAGRSTLYRVDEDRRAEESLTVTGEFLQLFRIR